MTPTTRRLFISYAHEDGIPFAEDLSRLLTAAGHSPWRDHERLSSQGGIRWSREITMQLLSADLVLVVLTPKAGESMYVEAEWMKALEYGRPVVPLLFLTCGVPLPLTPLQYIDFRTEWNAAFDSLLARMKAIDQPQNWIVRDRQTLEALKAVKLTASASRHPELDGLITELSQRIDTFQENLRTQNDRVEEGLKEARAKEAVEIARPVGRGLRRYGRRPPTPLEGFRDRTESQIDIAKALADPRVRMVTVIGRGGMGKTALACYVLNQIEGGRWPGEVVGPEVHGLVYLQHTPIQPISLERVLLYIAKVLPEEVVSKADRVFNNRDLSTDDRIERILELVATYCVIILLDNFEDLLDERGRIKDQGLLSFFRQVLIGSTGLRLVATSRAPINFSVAEQRFERQVYLSDGLPDEDALSLLQELDPNQLLGLSDAKKEELERLVHLTHGIPRALELVASILKGDEDNVFLLAVEEVAKEFYTRETVVSKLVEVNYATLRPEARRVAEALAIYGRPVPAVAIDFLLLPHLPGLSLRELLQPLIIARLVSFERGRDGRTSTLSLHPIDQDFLYRRLPEEGVYSKRSLHLRAAEYYRSQRTHDRFGWRDIAQLFPQLLEFGHLRRGGEYDAAIVLLGEYAVALAHGGHPSHCRDLFLDMPDRFTSATSRFAYTFTEFVWKSFLGSIADALPIGERALQLAIEIGDNTLEQGIREQLVTGYRFALDPYNSLAHAQWVSDRLRAQSLNLLESPRERIYILGDLILAYAFLGDVRKAAEVGRDAEILAYQHADPEIRVWALNALTVLYFVWGRYTDALRAAEGAERGWLPGMSDGLAYVQNLAGMAHFLLGDYPAAVAKLITVRATADEWDSPRPEALAVWNLSLIHTSHGVYDKGVECGREAESMLMRLGLNGIAPLARVVAESAVSGNAVSLIRAYLHAAEVSIHSSDLFPGIVLAKRAAKLAREQGMIELATEAEAVHQRHTDRLILPEVEE
jgi:hypothetical protein